ncbi:MAG: HDOD domain-containing protein [Nitrospinaceae bacterium]
MKLAVEPQIETLLERANEVATLPAIYMEVNSAVEDPESSFAEIGRLIAKDPSLSGRLLKIVNSPFYGFANKVETIPHAIAVIGTSQLRDLVLATTVMDKFQGISRKWLDMRSFWMHSIACGLSARIIAIFGKQSNSERFYTLGMLHDLGRLVMLIGFPDKMEEIIVRGKEGERRLLDLEQEIFGFHHAEVGYALLKQWRLSQSFQTAVLNSHEPSQDKSDSLDSAVLHLADVIVHAVEMGNSGDKFVPPLDSSAWQRLSLTPSMLPQIICQLDRQMEELAPMVL